MSRSWYFSNALMRISLMTPLWIVNEEVIQCWSSYVWRWIMGIWAIFLLRWSCSSSRTANSDHLLWQYRQSCLYNFLTIFAWVSDVTLLVSPPSLIPD